MPGPKPTVSKEDIVDLINQGYLKKEIATKLNVSLSTIKRHSSGLITKRISSKYICRTCSIEGKEHFYKDAKYQCKSCWNKRSYAATKSRITEYMESRGGAKCQICGYDKCVAALDFHHRDPTEKDPLWNKSWSIKRLKTELDKCDILCSNCHRELHWLS